MVGSKHIWRYILLFLGVILLFCPPCVLAEEGYEGAQSEGEQHQETKPEPIRAKVLKILADEIEENPLGSDFSIKYQYLDVKILSGKYKGRTIVAENVIDERMAYNLIVDQGDEVLLYIDEDPQGEILSAYVSDCYSHDLLSGFLLLSFNPARTRCILLHLITLSLPVNICSSLLFELSSFIFYV